MNRLMWSDMVWGNIQALSRTAKGVSASSSSEKPSLLVTEGAELAARVKENFGHAAAKAYSTSMNDLCDEHGLRSFVDSIAIQMSSGLLKGSSIYRTWVQGKYPIQSETTPPQKVEPKDLEREYAEFVRTLAIKLDTLSVRVVVEVAAWVERDLNWRIHPFADGCGRVSVLLGAWVLHQASIPPALIRDRTEYYTAMNASEEKWITYYSDSVLARQCSVSQ